MHRRRRTIALIVIILIAFIWGGYQSRTTPPEPPALATQESSVEETDKAIDALASLEVKGRAPKTGYSRSQFGEGWAEIDGCDVRNLILQRDLVEVLTLPDGCKVESGKFLDPYSAKSILFKRGVTTSDDVQIDHIVSLSDAWQKGAQLLSQAEREKLANDSLELLAVDGPTNMKKSDGDAATWLPPNKPYRCQFIARQIAVKRKYHLWVTPAERDAMKRVLATCPDQRLPLEESQ